MKKSTAADCAMEQAQAVLSPENVRPNAKKVVIFFTDGKPNHQNGFDGDVANDAIAGAKVLKDSGAMVFSIGVFDAIADKVLASVSSPTYVDQGKDPSNSGYVVFTDQLGDYMHVDGTPLSGIYSAIDSADVRSTVVFVGGNARRRCHHAHARRCAAR